MSVVRGDFGDCIKDTPSQKKIHEAKEGSIMKCVVCGQEFTPKRSWQKYCSSTCKRKAYHQREEAPRAITEDGPVIREFHCRKCGKLVQVRDHKDFRMRFCSKKCEESYWKHSHKNRPEETVFQFRCAECGTLVTISNSKDRRKRFCSALCRRRWSNKKQVTTRAAARRQKETPGEC